MKKYIIILSLALVATTSAVSQSISININLDKQPSWGPSGYDYAEYYYFPDVNIYYDVANTLFYYLSGSNWVSGRYLPEKYRKYDLYSMYKVVLNSNQPWLQNKTHKKSYSQYKGDKTQVANRYSSDSRYETTRKNNVRWVNTSAPNTNSGNNNQGNNRQDNKQNNKQNNSNQQNSSRRK